MQYLFFHYYSNLEQWGGIVYYVVPLILLCAIGGFIMAVRGQVETSQNLLSLAWLNVVFYCLFQAWRFFPAFLDFEKSEYPYDTVFVIEVVEAIFSIISIGIVLTVPTFLVNWLKVRDPRRGLVRTLLNIVILFLMLAFLEIYRYDIRYRVFLMPLLKSEGPMPDGMSR